MSRQTTWEVDCGEHGEQDPEDSENCICDEGWESAALAFDNLCSIPVQVQNKEIETIAAEAVNSGSNETGGAGASGSIVVTGTGNSQAGGEAIIPGLSSSMLPLSGAVVLCLCLCSCCACCYCQHRRQQRKHKKNRASTSQADLALQQLKLQLAQFEAFAAQQNQQFTAGYAATGANFFASGMQPTAASQGACNQHVAAGPRSWQDIPQRAPAATAPVHLLPTSCPDQNLAGSGQHGRHVDGQAVTAAVFGQTQKLLQDQAPTGCHLPLPQSQPSSGTWQSHAQPQSDSEAQGMPMGLPAGHSNQLCQEP